MGGRQGVFLLAVRPLVDEQASKQCEPEEVSVLGLRLRSRR